MAQSVLTGLALAALLLAPLPADAQRLNRSMCDSTANFNLRPFAFRPFRPAMPGIPMLRHTVDTSAYRLARCNDGSPAVMYIRPANAAYAGNPVIEPSTRWLIFFDGGGGCRDARSCLEERWCGGGGRVFDQAGKMSSRGAPRAIREVGGIWTLQPPGGIVNQFAQYNQVLVHYCSSDSWSGSARLRGLSATNGADFNIRFEGEAIVNAVFSTLLAGPTAADAAATADFYATALPDLSDATEVIVAGESAGSGVRTHLDRLRDWLVADNPAVAVRGVFDAAYGPGWWESGIDWTSTESPDDYLDYLLTEVEPVARGFWGVDDSALDASCLDEVAFGAAHTAITTSTGGITVGSHPQVCHDLQFVLFNHVTTPTFVRQDINDTLIGDRYAQWMSFPTSEDYWDAQFSQLWGLALGVGRLEPPDAPTGVLGPFCGKHVAIQTDRGFFRDRVAGPGAPPLSFHDQLVSWLGNPGPSALTIRIQDDFNAGPAYTPSTCF